MSLFSVQAIVNAGEQVAKLTITQAIKQSGVSRTHFYTHYIKKGLISVSEDNGKKFIDSSELVRVFPNLKTEQQQNIQVQTKTYTHEQPRIEQIEHTELVSMLREQVSELKADKEFLQSQVVNLTNRLPAPTEAVKKPNWFIRFWNAKDD